MPTLQLPAAARSPAARQLSTGALPASRLASGHVLAFDTSTERLAVALQTPTATLHLLAGGGAAASSTLLPLVHGLLAQAGIAMADLDAIAFGRGPGAFTGLRTACAVAQGLGFGLGRPLLPLDSLLIVAEDARLQIAGPASAGLDVGIAMDARMGEIYAGRYRWLADAAVWQTLQPPWLCSPAALSERWQQDAPQLLAGSALAVCGAALSLPAVALRIEREQDRAAALLRLALQAAAAGDAVAAADALPLYLRDKVALTTQERAAAAATAPGAQALGARALPTR